jgi:hypothetical protein
MTGYKEIKTKLHLTHTDKVYYNLMKLHSLHYGIEVQDTISFIVNDLYPYNSDVKNLKQLRHKLKVKLTQIVNEMKNEIMNQNAKIGEQKIIEFQRHNLI